MYTSPEVSTLVRLHVMWDIWHACLGHLGGELVRHLPLVATGVTVDINVPLSWCESCIMAKHTCQSHPSSSMPHAKHMLDLVHSDVCGPYPV